MVIKTTTHLHHIFPALKLKKRHWSRRMRCELCLKQLPSDSFILFLFTGLSPAQASDAPLTEVNSSDANNTENEANTASNVKIEENSTLDDIKQEDGVSNVQELPKRQPVVKLDRLSKEDMSLIQESLTKFVENKPKLAEELGISATGNNDQEASDAESESDADVSRKSKRKRKNYKEQEEDEDYAPDQFTALVGPNKSRKSTSVPAKPDPVVVKPKLRRLEKKFVPVLEKLSIEELMETNTYDRFNKTIENVLKTADELDTTELGKITMLYIAFFLFNILFFRFICGRWNYP